MGSVLNSMAISDILSLDIPITAQLGRCETLAPKFLIAVILSLQCYYILCFLQSIDLCFCGSRQDRRHVWFEFFTNAQLWYCQLFINTSLQFRSTIYIIWSELIFMWQTGIAGPIRKYWNALYCQSGGQWSFRRTRRNWHIFVLRGLAKC